MNKTTILTDRARLQRIFDTKIMPVAEADLMAVASSAAASAACQIRRYYAGLHKTAALSQSVLEHLLQDDIERSA